MSRKILHGTQEYHDLMVSGAAGPMTPEYRAFAIRNNLRASNIGYGLGQTPPNIELRQQQKMYDEAVEKRKREIKEHKANKEQQ